MIDVDIDKNIKHKKLNKFISENLDLLNKRFRNLEFSERLHNEKFTMVVFNCTDCGSVVRERVTRVFYRSTSNCSVCRYNNPHNRKVNIDYLKYRNIRANWFNMMRRCYNKHDKAFSSYGGKGVTVCTEWETDINNYIDWVLSTGVDLSKVNYKQFTVDRKDSSKGYSPDNCRFIDRSIQSRNQGLSIANKSGFIGVGYDCSRNRFTASISLNGKTILISRSKTKLEAYEDFKKTVKDKKLEDCYDFFTNVRTLIIDNKTKVFASGFSDNYELCSRYNRLSEDGSEDELITLVKTNLIDESYTKLVFETIESELIKVYYM